MTLRQAAQDVIDGRQARKEIEHISSDTKIARKCEVARSVVDLKREQQRLLTIQRRNTMEIAAYRHGVAPSAVRSEIERMGVEA